MDKLAGGQQEEPTEGRRVIRIPLHVPSFLAGIWLSWFIWSLVTDASAGFTPLWSILVTILVIWLIVAFSIDRMEKGS